VPVEFGKAWKEYLPQAALEILPDAGHAPYIDRSEAFVVALERFIDGVA
jgi:pimeloyl-ACP methyl ester carboxylesterase